MYTYVRTYMFTYGRTYVCAAAGVFVFPRRAKRYEYERTYLAQAQAPPYALGFDMSFAAALSTRGAPVLRHIAQRQHRNTPTDIDAQLELGERVQDYIVREVGAEQARARACDALASHKRQVIDVDADGSQPTGDADNS